MKKIFTFLILISLLSLNGYSQKKNTINKSSTKKTLVAYTEEDVKKYIADYFSFYMSENNYEYHGYKKISRNIFQVKVETCRKNSMECFGHIFAEDRYGKINSNWNSSILKLTISENGKYTINHISGAPIY